MKSEGIVTTTLPVPEILSRIEAYSNGMDRSFLESRKRDLFSNKVIDKINWVEITSTSASGLFTGAAGPVYKRSHIEIKQGDAINALIYSIYPPSWALKLFWITLVLFTCIPPLWIIIPIGLLSLFMFKVSGRGWVEKMVKEVEKFP